MASVGKSELCWRKSSFSSQGDCVEIAVVRDQIFVRDSKVPDGPVLEFTRSEWAALADGIKAGEFDDV